MKASAWSARPLCVSRTGVVVAAVATAVGALPLVVGFSQSTLPTGALYGAGWPAFGVAAALVLDRGSEPRVGRALADR